MASTSSNPPSEVAVNRLYSTQYRVAEGIPEMICAPTSSSVNHQNNAEIMNLSEGTCSIFIIFEKNNYCNEVHFYYSSILK
ncbi:hypothetical protein MtrunA17_Chr7g0221081 [Medicago truncatula]|uniref:Uncharacterized protein n=1 Tax=Medicago truncatula TaxID=3880 RepID=A0A396GTZ9_MEDTR|nr:hypothetical protein MtrunA17_Chr7g0221081 [Medicago truncatula]